MAKRRLTQLAYDALTLEGGLFNAEWLAKVAHLDAPQQKPDDYGIQEGLNLRDEIARAWRIAQAQWIKFQPSRSAPSGAIASTEKFVVAMLGAFGFAGLAKQATPRIVSDRSFPISHTLHHIPVLVAARTEGLDEGQVRFGEAGRRRSPFGLLQEYLNASDDSLWGLVCNGLRLRLLRDNASLTRPAWLEADLERIFVEERFADFSALWLTIHVSRYGRAESTPSECALEAWREAGHQAGTRAREELRKGVERALLELGQGFLSESANTGLRAALIEGRLAPRDYFQQLLRLVYRLIFLLTVEERGLLHPLGSDLKAEALYERAYGLRRLRERSVRHSAHDTHRDLYASLKITFLGLSTGEQRLGLPALGGLFTVDQTPDLDAVELQNRHLLAALWGLAWIARDGATERVNWRDMGPEELGSVYESLLELVPLIAESAQSFQFAGGAETKGNARKLSGSYYTPDSLVQALLDSALEPVIAQKKAERPDDEAGAILSINVIDPAVGSGHFLLAAARRLAAHVARARVEGQPGAAEHRHALRDVVSHCLFGVDRNPMALELAKIALWLEAMTPDAPLSFLDTHLLLGDALLGVFNPAGLAKGIPDDAYKPLTGDDPDVCARLRKRNRDARKTLEKLSGKGGQQILGFATQSMAAELAALDALPDETLAQIAAKRAAYGALRKQQNQAGLAEDLLLAAYLLLKQPATEVQVPTSEHLLCALTGQPLDAVVVETARGAALEHHVFHWRDAFAHVFLRGGFDCILGNPPWERIKLQEQEFFATREPEIATAPNAAARGRLIDKLRLASRGTPERAHYEEFQLAKRTSEASSAFCRVSGEDGGRFPFTGHGDVNTYALFAELFACLASKNGRAGVIVPTGIATDSTTAPFFASLLDDRRLIGLHDFQTGMGFFDRIGHARFKFCMLTIGCPGAGPLKPAFSFFSRTIQDFQDHRRHFVLSRDDIAKINPNTVTAPTFRSLADAELTARIYARVPVFVDVSKGKDGNPWGVSFMAIFHMSNDSGLFRTGAQLAEDGFIRDGCNWLAPGGIEPSEAAVISGTSERDSARYVPLYEAKMIHHFDHRWATYDQGAAGDDDARDLSLAEKSSPQFEVSPRYWASEKDVAKRVAASGWNRRWLMGWRDITNATNERTVIAAVFPCVAAGNNLPVMLFSSEIEAGKLAALLGCLSSLTCDYFARHKVGGTHLNYFIYQQLPVLPPHCFDSVALAFIVPRVLELTYTTHLMAPFARELGFDDCPFPWNDERRATLRAELDAWYARAYGLSRDDLRYVLDPTDVMGPGYPSETFRILKEKENRQFGEYRTRRLILEAWDALAASHPMIMHAPAPRRRAKPQPPYLPTSVPCCDAEAWLAGLVCDVIAYAGPMPEPALRLVLSRRANGQGKRAAVLDHWTSKERLDRLPQVLRWLRQLIGIPPNRDLSISAATDLKDVPGDERTEQLARNLVDAYRAQQAQFDNHRSVEAAASAASAPGSRDKRA